MLKVSKLADYATVIMTYMALHLQTAHNARDIATNTRIALPTVSKILKLLGRSGLVTAQRGVKGGYQLSRAPTSISIAEIVTAVDGDLGMTDCSQHSGLCFLEAQCLIRHNWQMVSRMFLKTLQDLSLADFARPLTKIA